MLQIGAYPILSSEIEFFEYVKEASEKNTELVIYYRDANGNTTMRGVTPLKLFRSHGNLYLDAYCHLREAARRFSVNDIQDYYIPLSLGNNKPSVPTLDEQALKHMERLGLNVKNASLGVQDVNHVVYYTLDTEGNNIRVSLTANHEENGLVNVWTVTVE